MDFIRKLVSQNKKRYETEKYNLDLSYVTDRIIAMAYPASGLEVIFRNRIDDVAAFLGEFHPSRYLIINISNRKYDYARFNNSVLDVNWPNHFPCPFMTLVEFVAKVAHYLLADRRNVVVIHCLAGKGRTGSFVVCLLLLSRIFTTVTQGNLFYEEKRGVRVDYQSQLRYLGHFQRFIAEGVDSMNFQPQKLRQIIFMTKFEEFYLDKDFTVQILDFSTGEAIKVAELPIFGNNAQKLDNGLLLLYAECKDVAFPGKDLLLVLSYAGLIGSVSLLRVNLSLYYVGDSVTVSAAECDDVSMILPKDFKIKIDFKPSENLAMETELRNKFNEFWKMYQEIGKILCDDEARIEFLFGEVKKQSVRQSEMPRLDMCSDWKGDN